MGVFICLSRAADPDVDVATSRLQGKEVTGGETGSSYQSLDLVAFAPGHSALDMSAVQQSGWKTFLSEL